MADVMNELFECKVSPDSEQAGSGDPCGTRAELGARLRHGLADTVQDLASRTSNIRHPDGPIGEAGEICGTTPSGRFTEASRLMNKA